MTATDPQPSSVPLGGDAGSTDAPTARSTARVWTGAVVGVAALAALAVWRLDRTSLWVDESFSLAATNRLGMSLTATKGTMALYYLGLWLWARLGTATWWLRSFSTLAAAGSVVLTAAIARRSIGSRVSWVPPVLLVGLPVFAWTATEARAYALETFVTCGAWYCLLRWSDGSTSRPGRWWWALAGLCLVGPFCHGLFIAQVPGIAMVLWLAGAARHRGGVRSRDVVRTVAVPVALAIVPTAAIAALGGTDMGATWGTSASAMAAVWWRWMLSPRPLVALFLGVLAALGAAGAVASHRATAGSSGTGARTAVVWVVASSASLVAVGALHGTFAPYYMAPTAPGVALLIGQGIAFLRPRRAARRLPASEVVAVGALALVALSAVSRPISVVEDWRGAARFVAGGARSGDAIAFSWAPGSPTGNASSRIGFEAAWHERSRPVTPASITDHKPLGVPQRIIDTVSLDQVHRAWSRHRRVWLVDYHGTLAQSGFLDDRDISRAYCAAESRRYAGGIEVTLYVRGEACPEGAPTVAAGHRSP